MQFAMRAAAMMVGDVVDWLVVRLCLEAGANDKPDLLQLERRDTPCANEFDGVFQFRLHMRPTPSLSTMQGRANV